MKIKFRNISEEREYYINKFLKEDENKCDKSKKYRKGEKNDK